MAITTKARATEPVPTEESAAANKATKEPVRPQPAPVQSREPVSVEMPRTGRIPQPAAPKGGESPAPENQGKRRRSRRHSDDDFGDFTYLHDPEETDPGLPGSQGRRAL